MLAVVRSTCRGRASTATKWLVLHQSGVGRTCNLSGFSRMMDMGGSPAAATSLNKSQIPNTSKNSKVQGVAFDFELLCHNIQEEAETVTVMADPKSALPSEDLGPSKGDPSLDKVKEVASLLNVDLDNPEKNKKPLSPYEDDDLSPVLGTAAPAPESTQQIKKPSRTKNIEPTGQDVRAKYANKLFKKGVEGGLAGIELAKNQVEDTMSRGDAAGHLNARKIAASQGTKGGSRWMSLTGTGKLLGTLTHRSMKIALVPRPKKASRSDPHGLNDDQSPAQRMQDLKNQLKDVEFNVLVKQSSDDSPGAVKKMVEEALHGLALESKVILFVSDQDASLGAAKDLGMLTCRIRPLNARRGNVTAHFTVKDIFGVQDVVNEMNGVSFNAVLNSSR